MKPVFQSNSVQTDLPPAESMPRSRQSHLYLVQNLRQSGRGLRVALRVPFPRNPGTSSPTPAVEAIMGMRVAVQYPCPPPTVDPRYTHADRRSQHRHRQVVCYHSMEIRDHLCYLSEGVNMPSPTPGKQPQHHQLQLYHQRVISLRSRVRVGKTEQEAKVRRLPTPHLPHFRQCQQRR